MANQEGKALIYAPVRVSPAWRKALDDHAARNGSNFAVEVRRAIAEYIEREGIPVNN